jgi:hypothetical protein
VIYVRKVNKTDPEAALVVEWLEKDEYHQSIGITPEQIWDGEVALIYDEDGPIMAVRFQRALRAAVQFNPNAHLRSARAGADVARWFQELAAKQGANEVIVRAGGRAVNFVKRLGFLDFVGQFLRVE